MKNERLDQEQSPEEFFNKYGFRSHVEMPHPDFKDSLMVFKGLEADYVKRLEREVAECRKYIQHQSEKMEWLRDREFLCYKAGKKESP